MVLSVNNNPFLKNLPRKYGHRSYDHHFVIQPKAYLTKIVYHETEIQLLIQDANSRLSIVLISRITLRRCSDSMKKRRFLLGAQKCIQLLSAYRIGVVAFRSNCRRKADKHLVANCDIIPLLCKFECTFNQTNLSGRYRGAHYLTDALMEYDISSSGFVQCLIYKLA